MLISSRITIPVVFLFWRGITDMKILKYDTVPYDFNIEVILYPKLFSDEQDIAAATYQGYEIPDGAMMPADKKIKPSEQQIIDYKAFIQDVEDMLKEHHELKLVYKNKSKDYSNYYSFLAQDDKGNTLFRFRLRLRVSTHNPKRSSEQKKNIAEEEAVVRELLKDTNKKPIKMTKIIIVNDSSEYDSYFDAFVDICNIVDDAVEKMQR